VKLYVSESHSSIVRTWTGDAEVVATCRVAYPETISALNRRFKVGDLAKRDYDALVKTFTREWPLYVVVDFDEIAAGRLAEVYGLRGFDAIHLSAAELLRSSGNAPSVAFSSFDVKLNAAATAEKFTVLFPK
jgi:predicted nucleic acid-binding protein